jgi:hypothetical protein
MRTATATTAIGNVFQNVYVEDYGFNGFNHRCRYVFLFAARAGYRAEIREISTGFENTYVAFASVKYYLFVKHSYTVKFLRAAITYASLESQFDIETNIYGIESTIKLNRIEINLCLRNTSIFYPYCTCVVNYLLAKIGQENFNVFKAIAISA